MLYKELIEKLKAAEIINKPTNDWVYCEDESIGNYGYFPFDEADHYLNGKESPCFLFDCDKEKWSGIDIDDAIENELSDWFDGAGDQITDHDELKEFIKKWNAKQNVCQYFPNYRRIIVLDTVKFNEMISDE